ncbi:TonB-dependent siderophore receptor [bacterium]|nr:TonB-dependent siderophore receptor [bacterium]
MVSFSANSDTSNKVANDSTTLGNITVESNANSSAVQFSSDNTAPVSKLGVSIAETPFSISAVDKYFIEDIGAKNIQDALTYSSGVYAGQFGFDTRGDYASVRGLDAASYLDGLRSIYGSTNSTRTETYTLDSIEVLKGPSSVLYGQSDLGGIINGTSKRPQQNKDTEIWLQVGSYDRKQFAIDSTGAITDDGKWLYRFVGLHRESGTQVNHVDHNGYVFFPSITWRPSDSTEITLMYNRQVNEGQVSAQFLPAAGTIEPGVLGDLDTDLFVGEPDWDRYDREKTDITLSIDHAFNHRWRISSIVRKTDSSADTREHWITIPLSPAANGDATRTIYTVDRETDVLNVDIRLEGEFATGNLEHNLVVGLDSQDAFWGEDNNFYGYGLGGIINLYNPVYGNLDTSVISPSDSPDNEIKQLGIYVVDNINIGRTVVSTALRYDDFKNTLLSVDGNSDVSSSDTETTGRLGVMYQFDSGISPYISYAEAFSPNLGTDGVGGVLDPTSGKQKEAGIKYLSVDQSFSVNVAYFDIEQNSRVSNGLTPGGISQLGATIDGWELEVKKKWNTMEVLANYTKLSADQDSTGERLPYVAEEFASVWGKYTVSNGLRFGLGARYTGTTVGADIGTGSLPEVPSYTVFDGLVGYQINHWDLSLNVQNIADKKYISWCRYEGADCGFGERRTMAANLRYRF